MIALYLSLIIIFSLLFFLNENYAKKYLYDFTRYKTVQERYILLHEFTTSLNSTTFSALLSTNVILNLLLDCGIKERIADITIVYYIIDTFYNIKVIKLEFIVHHTFILMITILGVIYPGPQVTYIIYLFTFLEFSTFFLTFRARCILLLKLVTSSNEKKKIEKRKQFYEKLFVLFFIFRCFTLIYIQYYIINNVRDHPTLWIGEYFVYLFMMLHVYWVIKIIKLSKNKS